MIQRNSIRAIADRLEAIEAIFRNYIKALDSSEKRSSQGQSKPVHISGEIHFPENVERNRSTEQARQFKVQKATAIAAILGTLTAIGIAVYQGHLTSQATEVTRSQLNDFESVEAAQIVIGFAPKVRLGKPGQGLIVDGSLDVTNTGQTVAKNLTTEAFTWEKALVRPPPGIPGLASDSSPLNVDSATVLGAQQTEHLPVGIQIGDVEGITANKSQSGISVSVTYSDVFGHNHSQSECYMVNNRNILEFEHCAAERPVSSISIPLTPWEQPPNK